MNADDSARRRQKRQLVAVAILLIAAGLAVLLFVTPMPLPMRIFVGLTDVVAGLVLLLVARQTFSDR